MKKYIINLLPDIIVQKRLGVHYFTMSLRDHAYWVFKGDSGYTGYPFTPHSNVWDLGCNIGYHAVEAAMKGCSVVAFDISKVNCDCLRQTALFNRLNIPVVNKPVTVRGEPFQPAATGRMDEVMQPGDSPSLSFEEAARQFDMPGFIKMDIEGGECEFLKSDEFKKFVLKNKITFLVETHNGSDKLLWRGFEQIMPGHYILKP